MGNCYSIFSNETSKLIKDNSLLYYNRNRNFYDNVYYVS